MNRDKLNYIMDSLVNDDKKEKLFNEIIQEELDNNSNYLTIRDIDDISYETGFADYLKDNYEYEEGNKSFRVKLNCKKVA